MSRNNKPNNSHWVNVMIYVGLLIVVFAFGMGFIDLLAGPATIDLAADDELETGFLPVYEPDHGTADPDAVEIDVPPDANATPTPEPFALPTAGPEISPTPTPTPDPGLVPDRLVIPSIELEAPIIPIGFEPLRYEGKIYNQWLAPAERAVGWHNTSVGLGAPGNTVMNGHHNIRGEVFRDLYRVEVGATIHVYSGDQLFSYVVVYTDILPERNQPLDVRLANSEWIQPTMDERLTLITCWPYESNTHRVVVVAVPLTTASQASVSP
jgi:sortase A